MPFGSTKTNLPFNSSKIVTGWAKYVIFNGNLVM
jgi:hypothetical protein